MRRHRYPVQGWRNGLTSIYSRTGDQRYFGVGHLSFTPVLVVQGLMTAFKVPAILIGASHAWSVIPGTHRVLTIGVIILSFETRARRTAEPAKADQTGYIAFAIFEDMRNQTGQKNIF